MRKDVLYYHLNISGHGSRICRDTAWFWHRKAKGESNMKHIKTLNTKKLQNTVKKGGCGECQTSCQSACKTSCTVGNQTCEHSK